MLLFLGFNTSARYATIIGEKTWKNLQILKLILEVVLLCSEQRIAFRDHQEQSN